MLGPLWSSSRLIQVVNSTKGMIHYIIPLSIEAPCPQIAAIRLEIQSAALNAISCGDVAGALPKEIVIKVQQPLNAASPSSLVELR